jgi:hypothetical protein
MPHAVRFNASCERNSRSAETFPGALPLGILPRHSHAARDALQRIA